MLEAYEGYWQKVPNVKRLIMKGVPEGTTRLAMLKKEKLTSAAMQGAVAEEVKRDSNLTLVDTRHPSMFWIEFTEQWDPKSVWHDKRVRLAVNYALNRQAVSEAACLSYCPPAGVIVPRLMDFALPTEPFPYDPQKAKQLLAEAGYPNGFDAGELVPIPPFFEVGEAVVNDLNAVGIRVRMRTMERAAFYTAWRKKSCAEFSWRRMGVPATPRPVWNRSCTPGGPMPMGVIRISMSSSSNSGRSATAPNGKQSCTTFSNSQSSASCLLRSWTCGASREWDHA